MFRVLAEIQGDFVIQRFRFKITGLCLQLELQISTPPLRLVVLDLQVYKMGNALILMGTAASGASGYAITGTALAVIEYTNHGHSRRYKNCLVIL